MQLINLNRFPYFRKEKKPLPMRMLHFLWRDRKVCHSGNGIKDDCVTRFDSVKELVKFFTSLKFRPGEYLFDDVSIWMHWQDISNLSVNILFWCADSCIAVFCTHAFLLMMVLLTNVTFATGQQCKKPHDTVQKLVLLLLFRYTSDLLYNLGKHCG